MLGGYFLPRIPVGSGAMETLDEIEDGFTLEYPKGWVGRRNTLRRGLNISDYSSSGEDRRERWRGESDLQTQQILVIGRFRRWVGDWLTPLHDEQRNRGWQVNKIRFRPHYKLSSRSIFAYVIAPLKMCR